MDRVDEVDEMDTVDTGRRTARFHADDAAGSSHCNSAGAWFLFGKGGPARLFYSGLIWLAQNGGGISRRRNSVTNRVILGDF